MVEHVGDILVAIYRGLGTNVQILELRKLIQYTHENYWKMYPRVTC